MAKYFLVTATRFKPLELVMLLLSIVTINRRGFMSDVCFWSRVYVLKEDFWPLCWLFYSWYCGEAD